MEYFDRTFYIFFDRFCCFDCHRIIEICFIIFPALKFTDIQIVPLAGSFGASFDTLPNYNVIQLADLTGGKSHLLHFSLPRKQHLLCLTDSMQRFFRCFFVLIFTFFLIFVLFLQIFCSKKEN